MKVCIILNGISRRKKTFYARILPPIQKKFETIVWETQYAGHAFVLAKEAVINFDIILAAGGDGTLNQVLNGLMTMPDKTKLPALGVIPLGTGNDFAKMCGIPADGNQIATLLETQSTHSTDVGKIICRDESGATHEKFFINECSIGMGPDVVRRLKENNRSLGPMLTYYKAIIATFFTHKPQPVAVKTGSWEWAGDARVVVVANGRSFGNSLYIAPDAKPDDGRFATFILADLKLPKFLFYLQAIKGGKKLHDTKICYNEASSVELSSPQKLPIEAEGEEQGFLPASVEIIPGCLKVLRKPV